MANQNNMPAVASKQVLAKPVDMLKTMLNAESVQEQFKNALGAHKDAFIASLIELYTGDASLQKCQPKLIVAEALRAATMRLPLNKALGFAYIVVYNNTVKDKETGAFTKVPTPTFIPGYKGYIQLAMRTGQYKTINADVVYEGELRKVDKLSGTIAFDGEKKSDKIVGYFCYFELLNGFSKTLYMPVEDMAKYAKKYAPGIKRETTVEMLIAKANDGKVSKTVGWEGNFNDMALKTVIRRNLSKYGYLSVEMLTAFTSDEKASDMERNTLVAEGANAKVLDVTDASYETVGDMPGEEPEQKEEQPKY